nr:hypothetical protein [Tanacetum cinerariifolium]
MMVGFVVDLGIHGLGLVIVAIEKKLVVVLAGVVETVPALSTPYQSNPATNAPLTYQFAPTYPSSPYQFAPTQPYHQAPTINRSPIYESSPTSQPTRSRGHGKNKCLWEESEIELLIEVLQDMGSDPSWKTDGCFKSNYLRHKEAKGLWDVPFPYFNQLELVYGRDRATGVVAEGFKDAIHNLEEEQNGEIEGENLGESNFYLSDDEGDVQSMPQTTQTTSNFNNAAKTTNKQKATFQGNKAVKKRKSQEVELEGIDRSFQMFVQGFNANFGNMENAVAHSMTDENMRQKATSEKLKLSRQARET